MNELIAIEQRNGENVVDARDLHVFLESKQDFSTWIKARIKKYGFRENQDYLVFHKSMENPSGGRPQIEYAISLGMAKELAMVEANDKGQQARRYFIEVEKRSKKIDTPRSTGEMLVLMANSFAELEARQLETETRLKELEAKQQTIDTNFYTVAGYASLRSIKVDTNKANLLGRACAKLSRTLEYPIGKAYDSKYGEINTYHLEVLQEIFEAHQIV